MSHGLPEWLTTALAFVAALAILIFIHELGHYTVARLVGVKILRFSIGLGRPLWRWAGGQDRTEWVVSAIPLGGYVRMLDEREGPVAPVDLARAFNRQSLAARSAIVLAGPLANLLLAWLLFGLLYGVGLPEPRACFAAPKAGSLAAQAGVRGGDCLVRLGGQATVTWSSMVVRWASEAQETTPLVWDIQRQSGQAYQATLPANGVTQSPNQGLAALGLFPWAPTLLPIIGHVVANSAAAQAGIRAGDRIMTVAGKPIGQWEDLVRTIEPLAQTVTLVTLVRQQHRLSLTLVPHAVSLPNGTMVGRIGVAPYVSDDVRQRLMVTVQDKPLAALGHGAKQVYQLTRLSLISLAEMVTGRGSWDDLGGPMRIASLAGQTARLGIIPYVQFIALISLSLGILNLLPIPLLDGGHLLYHALEFVRGKPLSASTMAWVQQIGLIMLVGMMGFSFYNDWQHFINH